MAIKAKQVNQTGRDGDRITIYRKLTEWYAVADNGLELASSDGDTIDYIGTSPAQDAIDLWEFINNAAADDTGWQEIDPGEMSESNAKPGRDWGWF